MTLRRVVLAYVATTSAQECWVVVQFGSDLHCQLGCSSMHGLQHSSSFNVCVLAALSRRKGGHIGVRTVLCCLVLL